MLIIDHLSRETDTGIALQEIQLEVQAGDFFALCGRDDAGKTELLHIIMGLDEPDSGEVLLLGENPRRLGKASRPKVRFVQEGIAHEEYLTGKKYLWHRKLATGNYDEKLQERLAEEFELQLDCPLLEMTYEQNKMIQLVGAICAKPQFLILDEPSIYLRNTTFAKLLTVLKEQVDGGMTLLVAEERYESLSGYCNKIAYMVDGAVKLNCKVSELEPEKKVVSCWNAKAKPDHIGFHPIHEDEEKQIYLYEGKMDELTGCISAMQCENWTVEKLSFMEQIEEDYDRWV